jgi:hypothetical protein
MENRTQFDLNTALERWRENLSRSPQFRAENVQELESHLRDSIATWQTKGLSDEEAFHIANRRLGNASALLPEFAKVNGKEVWLDRLLWMTVGVQLLGLLSTISWLLARWVVIGGLVGLGYDFKLNSSQPFPAGIIPGALLALVRALAFILAGWGCWQLVRRKENGLSVFAARFLRRPFFIGLVVVAGSMFMVSFLSNLDAILLFNKRGISNTPFEVVQISRSMANAFLSPATALALPALTVFLARRRLRLRTTQ